MDEGQRESHSYFSYERHRCRPEKRFKHRHYAEYHDYDDHHHFEPHGNQFITTAAPFPFNLFGK